jgi:hypothetical protein
MTIITDIKISGGKLIIDYKGDSPSSEVKYRGVNLSAYDEGSMAGSQVGLCTDIDNDTGGWVSYPTVPSNENIHLDTLHLAAKFQVGNAGPAWWNSKSEKSSPLVPISNTENSIWATSYPQLNQIQQAIKHGVNIFRLPFMPTFITDLATGWAQKKVLSDKAEPTSNFIYAQGNPDYFNYYMTTLDAIVKAGATVIIDNHVYQRWCPMNIPGTFSCLAPGLNNSPSSRNYSMDETTDLGCPYKLSPTGITEFKGLGITPEWGNSDFSYITGNEDHYTEITKSNILTNFCQKVTTEFSSSTKAGNKFANLPSGCKDPTKAGNKCYGGPTKRIIGVDCNSVLWYNILNLEFNLIDKDGTKGPPTMVKNYLKGHENVWLGLMNEPSEVNTRVLGKTYGKTINMIRKLGINNTLLVEGNYWAGLHAQISPIGENKAGSKGNFVYRPDSTSEGWTWPEDTIKAGDEPSKENGYKGAPAQIILDELNAANPTGIGEWKYDVHQYMDRNSTGVHGCDKAFDSGVRTLDDMKFATNFDVFENWCKDNGVTAICTEFGAQIGNKYLFPDQGQTGCVGKLNLFMQMIEESSVFDGWTIWRNSPAVSFASPYQLNGNFTVSCNDACKKSISWTNSVQWPPNANNSKAVFLPTAKEGPLNIIPAQKGNPNYYPYQDLYDNDKPFTDPSSKSFCMPYLWALKGKSSIDTKALYNCSSFGKLKGVIW